MEMFDYSDRLLKAMKDAGVSTHALAKALGVSYQAVKKVLDGKSAGFGTINHAKAAKYLRVTPDWLSTGIGPSTGLTHAQELAALSDDALDIAVHFDKLTALEDRTRVYVRVMAEIFKAMEAREAERAALPTHKPGPAGSPETKPD